MTDKSHHKWLHFNIVIAYGKYPHNCTLVKIGKLGRLTHSRRMYIYTYIYISLRITYQWPLVQRFGITWDSPQPSDAIQSQDSSRLVRVIVCRLFCAKPLPEQTLINSQLDLQIGILAKFEKMSSFTILYYKILSVGFRPLCLCLSVFNVIGFQPLILLTPSLIDGIFIIEETFWNTIMFFQNLINSFTWLFWKHLGLVLAAEFVNMGCIAG